MAEAQHYSSEQLARWGLLEQALREDCRDGLIAEIPPPCEAVLAVLREQALQAGQPLSDALLARQWCWQQWCRQTFRSSLSSHYLQRKHQLDQVVFWQLRVEEEELASELYLRLKEGETSFTALASLSHVQVQRHGPLRFEQLPGPLAARLRQSSAGVVQAPWCWGEAWLVVKLEQLFNASLDEGLQRHLLAEMGEAQLQQALNRGSG
ncbi:hypothetical protein KBY65_09150 [Cyanobium sp. Alchichica 3B3-8F6]|uniref:hypothetical protein n=1 Tax=Cyanobium sp. Alchichica 3B3-8F6 TaxID=2823696 RepID=UPI0020CEF634|nr:hypothetical protein [Cyanobium sp. Alchichica 3B3-8F6]MCP9882647.1 hypothetical protein [Cyanobium sp. Alchichica 3B3-8F6]